MKNNLTKKTDRAVDWVIRATNTPGEVIGLYLLMVVVGTALFAWLEGHTVMDSLYWVVTTTTSTGFGDITPKDTAGKFLAIVLMPATLFFIVPMMIVRVIESLNQNRHEWTDAEQHRHFANQESILHNQLQIMAHHGLTHRWKGPADAVEE